MWSGELVHRARDGREVVVQSHWLARRDERGRVAEVLESNTDVTGRKRAEEALRELNASLERRVAERTAEVEEERRRLYDVLETLPPMICLLTPGHQVAFANRAFRERFGEAAGRPCHEYCFGLPTPCPFCQSYRVLETGNPHHWELNTPDGGAILDVHNFPLANAEGSPLVLEMNVDITERRRAEEALEQRERTTAA